MAQRSSQPLTTYIYKFLEYCEVEKGLSPTTSKNYHHFLNMFAQWLKDNKLHDLRPHQLTPEHIWNYRLYLSRRERPGLKIKRTIKKTTQHHYLVGLRALLAYLSERDITTLAPDKIKLPKLTDKEKMIKFLTFDQVEKLMSMPDVSTPNGLRDRAMLEILFSTGMRVSELTSLNMRVFDAKNIMAHKYPELEITISGKGGSVRTIYFSRRALKWLGEYLTTRSNDLYPPLFINYHRSRTDNEHRLTSRSVERLVRTYASMAGLPVDATPHTLRHSFATDLLDQGADMRSVQELLGHKNISTTQIYTHVTNKQLSAIHKRFHRGNR